MTRARFFLAVAGVFGCATPSEMRASQLRSFEKVLPRIPAGSPDWSEMRFQGAELHRDEAEERLRARDEDGARSHLVVAASFLDEVLERDPSYAKTGEAVTSRAAVAIKLERHAEAVRFLQRAVELGPPPGDVAFVRFNLPRELRLAGECALALAQPVPEGMVGDLVTLERAQCLAAEPARACDELVRVLSSSSKVRREAIRVGRQILTKAASADRDACLARVAEPATVDALSKQE